LQVFLCDLSALRPDVLLLEHIAIIPQVGVENKHGCNGHN